MCNHKHWPTLGQVLKNPNLHTTVRGLICMHSGGGPSKQGPHQCISYSPCFCVSPLCFAVALLFLWVAKYLYLLLLFVAHEICSFMGHLAKLVFWVSHLQAKYYCAVTLSEYGFFLYCAPVGRCLSTDLINHATVFPAFV